MKVVGITSEHRQKLSESWVNKRKVILLRAKGYNVTKENQEELFKKLHKADPKLEPPPKRKLIK